jgi:hypothetical protein
MPQLQQQQQEEEEEEQHLYRLHQILLLPLLPLWTSCCQCLKAHSRQQQQQQCSMVRLLWTQQQLQQCQDRQASKGETLVCKILWQQRPRLCLTLLQLQVLPRAAMRQTSNLWQLPLQRQWQQKQQVAPRSSRQQGWQAVLALQLLVNQKRSARPQAVRGRPLLLLLQIPAIQLQRCSPLGLLMQRSLPAPHVAGDSVPWAV